MTRITLDRATMELLHNLSEPLEFCDETGWLLGTFTPEAARTSRGDRFGRKAASPRSGGGTRPGDQRVWLRARPGVACGSPPA